MKLTDIPETNVKVINKNAIGMLVGALKEDGTHTLAIHGQWSKQALLKLAKAIVEVVDEGITENQEGSERHDVRSH